MMMAMAGADLPLQHVQEVGGAHRRGAGTGGPAIVGLWMPPPPPRGDDGVVLDALEEEDVVGVHGRGAARADASADADASILVVAAFVMIVVAVAIVVALALHFYGVSGESIVLFKGNSKISMDSLVARKFPRRGGGRRNRFS